MYIYEVNAHSPVVWQTRLLLILSVILPGHVAMVVERCCRDRER